MAAAPRLLDFDAADFDAAREVQQHSLLSKQVEVGQR
jgi:hypothetical protein